MIIEGDLSPQDIFAKIGGLTALLPDDATIEQDGKPVLLRDMPDIKNVKDLPTLAKSYVESQREIGRRVRVPGKDAKPEEITAFKGRLIEAGILTAPLGSPNDYGIVKPEALPDGVGWSDELAGKLGTVLHRHGAPKALAADLLTLYGEALTGAQNGLKTSVEAGMAALKAEYGDKFDERVETAKRLSQQIFTTPEEVEFFERTGLGNHPGFLSVIMRLAPLAQQDSTFIKGLQRPGGEMSGDDVRTEIGRIMSDKNHPDYAGYLRQDKAVMAKVEELYKKAYGTAKVEIT